MSSTSNVYSSKPPISNPTRRTSINSNPSGISNVSNGNVTIKEMEDNIKSRPASSLSLQEWKQIIIGKLDEYESHFRQNKRIALFEDKYFGKRLPLSYIIASILLFSIISIIYIFSGMRSLSTIVGVMYPFYMSLKVLNAPYENKLDEREWLSYWIWYGIFTTIENISDILFCWMGNMYEIIKMAFFVYLYHPQTKGSLFLYRKILQPLVIQLIRYEHVMLENVETLRKNITIPEHEGGNNVQDQNFNNMTNISANTSNKNFGSNNIGMNNLPSKSNIMMPPSSLTNSTFGANAPLNINPNALNTLNTGTIPSTFSFQPMAFAATTPLTNTNTNTNTIPNPVISGAPIMPSPLSTNNNANANANTSGNNTSNNTSNNIIPSTQNNITQ